MSAAGGTPEQGSAVGGWGSTGPRRFAELTLNMAMQQFKLRYYGNVLGYLWTLLKPLLLFLVLYLAFTKIVRFGDSVENYPVYLIAAIVIFSYFTEATTTGVTSLVDQESLIRKVPMPIMTIPLAVSLNSAINLMLNMVAVVIFALIAGVDVSWRWLEMPFLLLGLIVFTTAVAGLLANLYVVARDMGQIWEVGAQVLFWGTPVVYTIESVPESAQELMMMSPLAVIMTQMRHAFIDPSAPSAAEAIGGAEWLLVPAAIVVATLLASFALQGRMAPRVAESL